MPLPLLFAALAAEGIYRGVKGQREREQIAAAQQQRADDVGAVVRGAGFGGQFGPQIGADPSAQQRLAGIMEGMNSMDPNLQREAIDQLGVLQGEMGIGMTPGDKTKLKTAQTELQLRNMELQRLQGGQLSTAQVLSTADNLYEDWENQAAPYQSRLSSYDELMSVLDPDNPDPASSVAVLFKFIKSMDDSVVRDSEGRLLTQAGGLVGELANLYNQTLGGGMFDKTTLQEIRYTATELARATQGTLEQINNSNSRRVARYSRAYMAPKLGELVTNPFAAREPIGSFPRAPRRLQSDEVNEDQQSRIRAD